MMTTMSAPCSDLIVQKIRSDFAVSMTPTTDAQPRRSTLLTLSEVCLNPTSLRVAFTLLTEKASFVFCDPVADASLKPQTRCGVVLYALCVQKQDVEFGRIVRCRFARQLDNARSRFGGNLQEFAAKLRACRGGKQAGCGGKAQHELRQTGRSWFGPGGALTPACVMQEVDFAEAVGAISIRFFSNRNKLPPIPAALSPTKLLGWTARNGYSGAAALIMKPIMAGGHGAARRMPAGTPAHPVVAAQAVANCCSGCISSTSTPTIFDTPRSSIVTP